MRVVLRADASASQGTGHVMRCLTLAEELQKRGHHVTLLTNHSQVDWLEKNIKRSSVKVTYTEQHSLNQGDLDSLQPDWVVTDSYEIPSDLISALRPKYKVLAIIDGSSRGVVADLYLDHNLGAERADWPADVREKLLAGSGYVLIRDEILKYKASMRRSQHKTPRILAVMGGSDPTGTIVAVARSLKSLDCTFEATLVAGNEWADEVRREFTGGPQVEVITPTPELPLLFSQSDVVISAAGTSAWEVCTLGIPSVLLAVVDNQMASLTRLVQGDLVEGIFSLGISERELVAEISTSLNYLLSNGNRREKLTENCEHVFDGRGKIRVVDAMEEVTL